MKKTLVIILLAFVLTLSGCDSNAETTTTTQVTSTTTEYIPTQGDRSMPNSIGETYTLDIDCLGFDEVRLDFSIDSIVRGDEAENQVVNSTGYNTPSDEGFEYVQVTTTFSNLILMNTDEDILDYYERYGFNKWYELELVSESGVSYPDPRPVNQYDSCDLDSNNDSCTVTKLFRVVEGEKLFVKYYQHWFKTFGGDYTIPTYTLNDPSIDYGTIDNPVPFGDTKLISGSNYNAEYSALFTINSVIRGNEAENILLDFSTKNTPSESGKEYIIVNMTITLVYYENSEDHRVHSWNPLYYLGFYSVGNQSTCSGYKYISKPNSITQYGLYQGGTSEGNYIYFIDEGDTVLLQVEDEFFSLN